MSLFRLNAPRYRLALARGEHSLDVREVSITEGLSQLFQVDLVVRTPEHDLDLETIVSSGAALRIDAEIAPGVFQTRTFNGICCTASMIRTEPTGLSTFSLRIVPALWRATLRENCRIFQHLTIPEIATQVLAELGIAPRIELRSTYPTFEYCVQYRETDFAFLSRLLEAAGITYYFAPDPPKDEGAKWEADNETRLVLTDRPEVPPGPEGETPSRLPFFDTIHQDIRQAYVTKLCLRQDARSGAVTVRSHDFRVPPDRPLVAESKVKGRDAEALYERSSYEPGAFTYEPGGVSTATPVADDRGVARYDADEASRLALRRLAAHRVGRRRVELSTNRLELWPGTVFGIDGHPRTDISAVSGLLVEKSKLDGNTEQIGYQVEAVFAADPFVPPQTTAKPHISGVQSATVVGPNQTEIHTDEFGRVRVQFHWDRENRLNEKSSCWIRVSQGWAGSAYGMVAIPRVGQEVLVEFFEGDPDQPVIVGRVFNATNPVPYALPENKTKSGWKSSSSTGAKGFNELMFDDAKGREMIHLQAQKDYTEVIKSSYASTVLGDKTTSVGGSETRMVGVHQTSNVGGTQITRVGEQQISHVGIDRAVFVGRMDLVSAMEAHSTVVGPNGCGIQIQHDEIVLTTGKGATITLKGGAIFLDAELGIQLTGARIRADAVKGGTCEINCGPAALGEHPVGAEVHTKSLAPSELPDHPAPPVGGGASIDPAYVLTPQEVVVTPPGPYDTAAVGTAPVFDEIRPFEAPKEIDAVSEAPPPTKRKSRVKVLADNAKKLADFTAALDPEKAVESLVERLPTTGLGAQFNKGQDTGLGDLYRAANNVMSTKETIDAWRDDPKKALRTVAGKVVKHELEE
ncbi:MAG: type VI secretion system tip protein VgrG [Polyangiaceae bacterium]|nr:type VI secretion system tip protein VgrG [Polyangiaceae bacterium]